MFIYRCIIFALAALLYFCLLYFLGNNGVIAQSRLQPEIDYIVKLRSPHSEISYLTTVSSSIPDAKSIQALPAFQKLVVGTLVEKMEPNFSFNIESEPNDPGFIQQWGLAYQGQTPGKMGADIGAIEAWDIQTSTQKVVGLIDTGIDYGHEDLKENIWQNLAEDADGDGTVLEWNGSKWILDPGDLDGIDADGNGYIDDLVGWDFVNNDNDPFDDNGHGTHVAGIVGARGNNNLGITGVVWEVPMMALKAFNNRGAGSLSTILPALQYARQMGVSLTNNSWGGPDFSQLLYDEIELAAQEDIWCVAAAGNYGRQAYFQDMYPASYDLENILSVAASNSKGQLAQYSNYHAEKVDLAAPGSRIYSTLPQNFYGFKTGTSMATPLVSGALLLLMEQFPSLEMEEQKSKLLAATKEDNSLRGKCFASGRLNVYQALVENSALTIGDSLIAGFNGTWFSCVNQSLSFVNTSQSPNPALTSYSWWLNDSLISNQSSLQYVFPEAGIYELRLELAFSGQESAISKTVHIQGEPSVSLGPDTAVCASAYLLEAGTEGERFAYHWKRMRNPGELPQVGLELVWGPTDSIYFGITGGNYQGYSGRYVLTDTLNQIVQISTEKVFAPQDSTGTYFISSVYFDQAPLNLQTGQTLDQLAVPANACLDISAPFQIQIQAFEELGDKPWQVVRQSGTYIVEARDECGNLTQDTILIALTNGCVWPGDVNTDGVVNLVDFLYLGVGNQQTGSPRDSISGLWESKTSLDWGDGFSTDAFFASGVDYKHADCNGDGLVDLSNDSTVIANNLGFLHEMPETTDSQGVSLWIEHRDTYFINNDSAVVELGILLEGPGGTDVTDLFGYAVNLYFSEKIAKAPEFTPDPSSWMHPVSFMAAYPNGQQQTAGAQYLQGDRKMAGISMVGRNRTAFTGKRLAGGGIGVVIVVDDLADDPDLLGYTPLTITTEDAILIDENGAILSQSQGGIQNSITVDILWPNATASFPVEWVDFTVRQFENDGLLEWQTATEINTGYFEIQRSVDGNLFSPVGTIKASGNSQEVQSYRFLDQDIASLGFPYLYYRLKQVDQNGQFSYSETRKLAFSEQGPTLYCTAFPNPTRDELTLEFRSSQDGPIELSIFNGLGQVMLPTTQLPSAGVYQLSTSNWPVGIYYIRFENAHSRYTLKVQR